MSEPIRLPKLGDIVLYHESQRQDVWDPLQTVTWPAIVTDVFKPVTEAAPPRVRLTVFRPFDKPLWDVTADYAPSPQPRHWSWP
jgi:hypothetical protein